MLTVAFFIIKIGEVEVAEYYLKKHFHEMFSFELCLYYSPRSTQCGCIHLRARCNLRDTDSSNL